MARECQATRERVALFDESSFAKFQLSGRDAERAMGWICANDVSRPVGSIVYTQMLNAQGGIECDLTVVRLAADAYYLVTGTGFATHDFDWIARHVPAGLDARLTDVTSAYSVLALMGPRARDVLATLTRDDVGNAAFPFGRARRIQVAGAPVLALRVTYVGELGWELHVPVEFAATVYAAIMNGGAAHGITNGGYRAIESLRLEKGYRAWGADIGPDHTPFEAGLGWAVKLKTGQPFMGRTALEQRAGTPLKKWLCTFTNDDPDRVLLGRETLYRDGERVGWLGSGGYGHTVGKNIGLRFVRRAEGLTREYLLAGRYELEVATERVPCTLHLGPLYDPGWRASSAEAAPASPVTRRHQRVNAASAAAISAWRLRDHVADRRSPGSGASQTRTRRSAVRTRNPIVTYSAQSFGGWTPMMKIITIDRIDSKANTCSRRAPCSTVPWSASAGRRRRTGRARWDREGEKQEDHRAGHDDRVHRCVADLEPRRAPDEQHRERRAGPDRRHRACDGVGETRARSLEAGRPPSREKAIDHSRSRGDGGQPAQHLRQEDQRVQHSVSWRRVRAVSIAQKNTFQPCLAASSMFGNHEQEGDQKQLTEHARPDDRRRRCRAAPTGARCAVSSEVCAEAS